MFHQFSELLQIPPPDLYARARETRRQMEGCLARLGLQLLALERAGYHRDRGCSSMTQFAVRHLQLSGKKAYELLRATRALLHLPLLAAAFFSGELGWGKVREITRVATGQTDRAWLEFGLNHDTEAVQRQVSMSPAAFSRRNAAAAAGAGAAAAAAGAGVPSAEQDLCRALPDPADGFLPLSSARLTPDASAASGAPDGTGCGRAVVTAPPGVHDPVRDQDTEASLCGAAATTREHIAQTGLDPLSARPADPVLATELGEPLIQVVFRLTPAQFAVYQRAEELMRQRRGKRLPRAEVLVGLAEEALSGAAPRSRARLPILVRVDASTGSGWLETREGLHPASSQMVAEALARGKVVFGERSGSHPGLTDDPASPTRQSTPEPPGTSKPRSRRKAVPVAVLQLLWLRSGGRCEVPGCYAGAPLHVHHETPVCDGGENSLEGLSLRCAACHRLHHEADFGRRAEWRKARANHRQRDRACPVDLVEADAVSPARPCVGSAGARPP